MELISVIVPVYKVEEYLDKCVQSIVDQTYSNLEIILVDDGSPDRCGDMCEQWAKKDSRIRVLHKPNGGLSDARNAGMEISAGTYTAFIDSDDWIAPDFIQVMYDAIKQTGAQIAGCDVYHAFLDQDPEEGISTGEIRIYTRKEAITDILQYKGFRAVAWNKLYLSSLLKGEKYPVGKHHEDEFFTYRIFGKADKLVYVDKPMYYYLQRQGSIMHSFTIKRLDALEAYLERLEYLKKTFPDLYCADKLNFCVSCAVLYSQAQTCNDPSATAIKRKIKELRKNVCVTQKEARNLSFKEKLYVRGTGFCMGVFCTALNMRKQIPVIGKWFTRIRNRLVITVKSFRSDLYFSPYFAMLRLGSELGGRLHLHKLSQAATEKKNRWIDSYLEKQLKSVCNQFENDTQEGHYAPNAPIWVCWWSGEETAPPLVERCIQSIRKNANGHPIHLITESNYAQYLDIPEYILTKVQNGTMCVANFSDYLRFSLLARYGGLWLDATIYCDRELPEDIFKRSLFTCKGRTGPGAFYSDYRWTAFCFGGYQGNVALRFAQALLDAYWKDNSVSIDYLLVDYLVHLAYRKNATARRLLDELPENNLRRDDLQAAMNAALPASRIDQILQPDTVLYKLSWREKYKAKTENGKESVYGAFLKGFDHVKKQDN